MYICMYVVYVCMDKWGKEKKLFKTVFTASQMYIMPLKIEIEKV